MGFLGIYKAPVALLPVRLQQHIKIMSQWNASHAVMDVQVVKEMLTTALHAQI